MQGEEADQEEDLLEHAHLGKAVQSDIRGLSTGVTASFAAVGGAIKQIPDLALQMWQILKVSNVVRVCNSLNSGLSLHLAASEGTRQQSSSAVP